jgi:hypothetical protein
MCPKCSVHVHSGSFNHLLMVLIKNRVVFLPG